MKELLTYYAVIIGICVTIGEIIIHITKKKYSPFKNRTV